jgi:hypothetical protein
VSTGRTVHKICIFNDKTWFYNIFYFQNWYQKISVHGGWVLNTNITKWSFLSFNFQYLRNWFLHRIQIDCGQLSSQRSWKKTRRFQSRDLGVIERWCLSMIRDIPEVTAIFAIFAFFSEWLGFLSELIKNDIKIKKRRRKKNLM